MDNELDIPRIPIKITREGDWLKLKVGRYQLKAKALDDLSQTYDFITIEQFLCNSAKVLYNQIVTKEQIKKDLMSLTAEKQIKEDVKHAQRHTKA